MNQQKKQDFPNTLQTGPPYNGDLLPFSDQGYMSHHNCNIRKLGI